MNAQDDDDDDEMSVVAVLKVKAELEFISIHPYHPIEHFLCCC